MTTPTATFPLPPGSTIGILGSGQLGRMLAMAAARLGLKCHVYADGPGPAFDVAAATTIAAYDDETALAAFATSVSVATYEFENIPQPTVEFLARRIREPRAASFRRFDTPTSAGSAPQLHFDRDQA